MGLENSEESIGDTDRDITSQQAEVKLIIGSSLSTYPFILGKRFYR